MTIQSEVVSFVVLGGRWYFRLKLALHICLICRTGVSVAALVLGLMTTVFWERVLDTQEQKMLPESCRF